MYYLYFQNPLKELFMINLVNICGFQKAYSSQLALFKLLQAYSHTQYRYFNRQPKRDKEKRKTNKPC